MYLATIKVNEPCIIVADSEVLNNVPPFVRFRLSRDDRLAPLQAQTVAAERHP